MSDEEATALEKAKAVWAGLKSGVETIGHIAIGLGGLALVIHSWILLSNGKQREALGAVVSALMGAAGAYLYLEQYAAAAHAALHLLGAALGRADRKESVKGAALHAVLAAVWWALLAYGEPILRGFGFPAQGLETTVMSAAFWVLIVYHSFGIPTRLRLAFQAAVVKRSADPGSLPPIGGIKL